MQNYTYFRQINQNIQLDFESILTLVVIVRTKQQII